MYINWTFKMLQTKDYTLCFLLVTCLIISPVHGSWLKLPHGCIVGHDAEISKGISNATECAEKCDSPDYPSCASIEFISSKKLCRFSPAHSQYPKPHKGSNVEVPCPEDPGIEYWQRVPVVPKSTYPYIQIPNTCIIGLDVASINSRNIEECWAECNNLAKGCKAIEYNSLLNECHLHGSFIEFSTVGNEWSSPCAINGEGSWVYRQSNSVSLSDIDNIVQFGGWLAE
ncbi:unnamed protein product [Owenia fusiformis]|uniref:Apple domain-containing protein n=1 Tax=Owenia fusiformis TaxID=6347 RepID=A0A8J1XJ45_OWEFU|nr:unnamed protein product [Owenia fusiformis]